LMIWMEDTEKGRLTCLVPGGTLLYWYTSGALWRIHRKEDSSLSLSLWVEDKEKGRLTRVEAGWGEAGCGGFWLDRAWAEADVEEAAWKEAEAERWSRLAAEAGDVSPRFTRNLEQVRGPRRRRRGGTHGERQGPGV
jgi:hypothetical protein